MDRHRSILVAVLVTLSISACGSPSTSDEPAETSSSAPSTSDESAETPSSPPSATPPEPYTGYPRSIAVLGHSQATGENTEPFEGGDTKTNSWATGTNPRVRSIYQRILENSPDIEGHAENYAQPSATIQMIGQQAAFAAKERPDLVLVQAIDADIVCPATDDDLEQFGEGVDAVLDTFAEQSPATRVFFVTQFGSPQTYAESLTRSERRELGSSMGGPGPCAFVDPKGRLVPREVDRLERIIRAFEQKIAEVCDARDNCAHDHGAFSDAVDQPGDYTDDLNHLSLQGLARAAGLAWRALQEERLIPTN